MNKNIKMILFIFITISIILATALFVKRYDNKQGQTYTIQNKNAGQLDKYLFERMNHKIIDTSIPKSTISFEQRIFNFGNIKSGDVMTHKFKFTNTGNNPLIIFDVKGTCGCTVPGWSNKLVNPGDTESILIKFNSANESGFQNKKVRIFANSKPIETDIFFKANVIN
jgi:hypothetical protein